MKIALLCLAMLGVSCSAFLVPQGSFVQVIKQGRQRASIQSSRGKGSTVMLLGNGIPEAASSTSWLLAAASSLEKFVPDTLADMAGTLGSDAVVPVSPDMMDAASQAAEEVSKTSNLPPPYTLVVFAGILFVLAGAQQLSLGNVFDEEAKTGGSSGAVARKMNMRNRSFFKKK